MKRPTFFIKIKILFNLLVIISLALSIIFPMLIFKMFKKKYLKFLELIK